MVTTLATGTSNWQNYPNCLSKDSSAVELELKRTRLIEDAPRLFAGQGEIEAWFHNGPGGEPTIGTFQQDDFQHNRDCMYFIRQRSSWASLETSLESVQRLLTAYSVSPDILDVIHSFGAKVTGEDDPFFNHRSYQLCHAENGSGPTHFEICYLLRSFELHGRSNLKNPWSLRQMAVYQKYDIQNKHSIWIFVQPFQRFRNDLWEEFSRSGPTTHPLGLHAYMLGSEATNWRWYLNDLRLAIYEVSEKAKHSSVKARVVDYDTSFVDCQRLQTTSEKVSLAQEVLSANSAIASLIQAHATDFDKYSNDKLAKNPSTDISNSMEDYLNRLKSFMSGVVALQRQAVGIEQLLSQLLSYKNMDLLNDQVFALRTLTAQVHGQSIMLRMLTEKSGLESRTMTIVTVIATIYLPANLIAQIFSTPLVQFPKVDISPKVLSVQRGMWIYVTSSIFLAALTLLAINVVGRWKKSLRP